jgi:predicted HTH transcriptional regulator
MPEPSFKEHCGGLLVTIPRSRVFSDLIKGDPQNDPQNDTQKLTSRQVAILAMVGQDIYVTASTMSKMLNASLSTIRREIRTLNKLGFLQYAGSSKDGHWEVLKGVHQSN